jgi:hypothetical protein
MYDLAILLPQDLQFVSAESTHFILYVVTLLVRNLFIVVTVLNHKMYGIYNNCLKEYEEGCTNCME